MKYIKTYEYVRNIKYSSSLVNDFIEAVKNIDKDSYVIDVHNNGNSFGNFWFAVNPKFETEILKLITKFKYKASRTGLMFNSEYDGGREFSGTIKEIKLKRVKPTKFIYHTTEEHNVDDILENGLNIGLSEQDKWGLELTYPNAIFASLEGGEFQFTSDKAMLVIDTTDLPNKWWVDLNFYSPEGNISFRDFIMTFENIPPRYISLVG